jgi:hypothetical protein
MQQFTAIKGRPALLVATVREFDPNGQGGKEPIVRSTLRAVPAIGSRPPSE